MTAITKLPPLHGKIYDDGYDGRYRLWTVSDVPFDFFPSRKKGGPNFTVHTKWRKSLTTTYDSITYENQIGGVELNISRFDDMTLKTPQRIAHPLDGTEWETEEEADRAAYEAGVIAFMVYVRDEAKYGIVAPSDQGA
jgi:hypothetical protein